MSLRNDAPRRYDQLSYGTGAIARAYIEWARPVQSIARKAQAKTYPSQGQPEQEQRKRRRTKIGIARRTKASIA